MGLQFMRTNRVSHGSQPPLTSCGRSQLVQSTIQSIPRPKLPAETIAGRPIKLPVGSATSHMSFVGIEIVRVGCMADRGPVLRATVWPFVFLPDELFERSAIGIIM